MGIFPKFYISSSPFSICCAFLVNSRISSKGISLMALFRLNSSGEGSSFSRDNYQHTARFYRDAILTNH